MTSEVIRGLLPSRDVVDALLISVQPPMRRPMPVLAYPQQDLAPLKQGLNAYEADPEKAFSDTPEVKLYLRTVHNAQLVVDDGLDGVIVTVGGQAIEEPSCFSNLSSTEHMRDIGEIPLSPEVYDDLFVAFDGAWGNYYHWILYGLAKASMAYPFLPAGCRIVVPDYKSRIGRSRLSYSEATYESTIAAVGAVTVPGRQDAAMWVDRLPSGRYRARRIHYLWTEPRLPTDLLYLDRFFQVFSEMRCNIETSSRWPKRLIVSRAKTTDERISTTDRVLIEDLAVQRGFQRAFLEDMTYAEQMEAFFNAEAVIAPHGAGLANMLFGRRSLRVLELNSDLDSAGYIRACFYQMAVQRGLTYTFLNANAGDFTAARFQGALDVLCGAD